MGAKQKVTIVNPFMPSTSTIALSNLIEVKMKDDVQIAALPEFNSCNVAV